ncbi:hypothetical protein [Streptomyces sp. DH37]|uniref:hypothetical protein n=1 Tax=Streptomyces sp. DH37 TaxID=3040122 RepID=UPI00244295E2|nr:hypothetical protein [Streptomyces sp. DH37]MDG9703785.1 hypothetical protein [Streptomyces sp. DH37]
MADHDDEMTGHLGEHLSKVYALLVMVCDHLPLPIALPTGFVMGDEAITAVQRVAEIGRDQTLPEDRKAELVTGCLFWLGALDLLRIQMEEPHPVRVHSAAACLITAERNLASLGMWLAKEEGHQE